MQIAPGRAATNGAGLGRWALLALWVVACLVAAPSAWAQLDPPGRVGRLAALQGDVWVYEPEQGEWVAALLNRPFTSGDRLATAPDASAEVQIGSTTLLLGSQTELEALRLDDERMQFRLQRGQLAWLLRSQEAADELELQHPEARFVPLRPGLYRIDRLAEASDASVLRGEMRVDGHSLSMTLQAGQRAAFWREGALGDTTRQWLTPQQDGFALAVQRHDQAASRLAGNSHVPPEMTGAEALERHGQWQQHPEYGAVWSPQVVAVDWAPYRHGRWVWLRPWGWTWVDDAPWGFAPSHYGRWLWWGNRWCWAPGQVARRPVFAPALVGWLGTGPYGGAAGSRPPPMLGWVPLGPRDPYRPAYSASPGYLKRLNPHVPQGPLPPPNFGNRHVPGAVTLWPAPALAPRQPVATAALRADEMALKRQWQAGPFHPNAPARPASPMRDDTTPRRVQPPLGAVPPQAWPRSPLPAPTTAPTPSPVTAPVTPPVTARVAAPVPAPLPAPVAAPVATPVATPVAAPAAAPVAAPLPAAAVPAAAPIRPPATGPAPWQGRPTTALPAAGPPSERRPANVAAQEPLPVNRPPAAAPMPMPLAPAPPRPQPPAPPPTAAAPPPALSPAPSPPSPPSQVRAQPFTPPAAAAPAAAPAAPAPRQATAPPFAPGKETNDGRGARPGTDPGERRRTPESRSVGRER